MPDVATPVSYYGMVPSCLISIKITSGYDADANFIDRNKI